MKSLNKKNSSHKPKDILLRSFLIISIICCVFLVSNCDQLFDLFGPGHGGKTSNPPEFGGSESGSYATQLFKSVAEGAAGEIGGSAASWAMSAIGLSNGSPDYSAQLDKIDNDLNTIINQLAGIQDELTQINAELMAINCSEWQTGLSDEIAAVKDRWQEYSNYVTSASDSETVADTTILRWALEVLAQPPYTNYESMQDVLNRFSSSLLAPNSGAIPVCIQALTAYAPHDNSFGTDTSYYKKVRLYTDYYYAYQVKALFLYSEAQHYMAWIAAGRPVADTTENHLSADSVSYVCSNSNAALYCNAVTSLTNQLYNDLISQYSVAGAPYTDQNLVLMYNQQDPFLWPKSLEDFTTAHGDKCADPLISANPCGITAGFYDEPSMGIVTYKGYSGWLKAGTTLLTDLLAGWKSGTAGNYLQTEFGLKNMKNKVIISSNVEQINLNEGGSTQNVIPFIDTDFDYNWFSNVPGLPVIDGFQFQAGVLVKSRNPGNGCYSGHNDVYTDVYYKTNSKMPSNRNHFYDAYGHAYHCGSNYIIPLSFSTMPGWLASQNGTVNHEASARQYRWPVRSINDVTCTENRSNKNAGGVWTMCGDDFTAFLDFNVPRPQTCDNHHASVTCNISASVVANAKSVFGNNSKGKRRL